VTRARAELARREETEDRIGELLNEAQAYTKAGQLVEPAEDNALYFLEAAKQAGARPATLAPTAHELAAAMVARGVAATHAWDLDSADAWLDHAREVQPEIDSLAAAEIELAAARAHSERAEQWLGLARERMASDALIAPDKDSAAYYLGLLRADTPEYPSLPSAEGDLAQRLQQAAEDAIAAQSFDAARQALDVIAKLGMRPPGLAQTQRSYASARASAEAAAAEARLKSYATLVRRKYVPPEYPLSAERRQIEGRVELALTVDPTGKVSHVEVTDAKPRDIFDKAAIAAAQRWEYEPAEVNGKAVESRTLVAIDFNLE
jgi:TonB family protein